MKKIVLKELFPETSKIKDLKLYDAVERVWQRIYDESKWDDLMQLPVSANKPDYPHIIHNRCVLKMAIDIAEDIKSFHKVNVNMDDLIAAAVLQDASKLLEYSPDAEKILIKTEDGNMYPHSFLVASIAREEGIKREIVSSILTHSPNSADIPKGVIGKILFFVDQIDMVAINGDRWKKKVILYR